MKCKSEKKMTVFLKHTKYILYRYCNCCAEHYGKSKNKIVDIRYYYF